MDPDVSHIIFNYINDPATSAEEVFNKLSSLQCSKIKIASFIWTFSDLSKGENIFTENAYNRLQELIVYMAEKSEKYKNLFFICLDRGDIDNFPEINKMRKSFAIISRSRFEIEKYQSFNTNPEGFSRLLLIFFLKRSNPNDLIYVIGEHKLDPDVVLNIVFDLIKRDKTYKYIPFVSIFSIEQILPFVFNGIYNEGDDFYYCILSYLLHIGKVKYQNLWKVVGQPSDILLTSYIKYLSAIKTHSQDLVAVRTILPGMTKEESYPSIFFEHEKECQKYRDELCHSFFFRLQSISQPFDFKLFSEISQFDPCIYTPIAEVLSNLLYNQFLNDPVLFLRTQQNLDYLCTLSCHCTENKLIVGICRFPDLIPPYILSNFILPSLSLNNCAWQLSICVYECMMHYSMYIRRQIYKKFSDNQKIISDSIIKNANVTRKMTLILFKRLSIDNISQYSLQVSKLFLRSPSIATEKLLDYLFTITNISSIPFLIITDLSPLSLDYLLLEICDQIQSSQKFSDWPIEIATFLGKTFSEHYKSMDLHGYINFIKKGLKKHQFRYLCLLKALITEMATVNYRGNLTKSDIELRTGQNLLNFSSRVKIDSCDEFNNSTKLHFLQVLLLKDDTALNVLAHLDMMLQKGDVSDPERLDELRFTFITICDFLSTVEITTFSALELVNKFHLSLSAAIKIARPSGKELRCLSPRSVPSDLFGIFWCCSSKDFHVPIEKFREIESQFKIRIEETDDEDFRESLLFVKDQLTFSMEKQKERVEAVRREIGGKAWFTTGIEIDSIYDGFVNHCIIPRMMFSQEDSRYCALFVFSLAHFTDFQLSIFNLHFTKRLHFTILASTFEESRCIGLFLSKLLKFNRDRLSEDDLHAALVEKFDILLTRSIESGDAFLANKTLTVLDLASKDFPKDGDNDEAIRTLLDRLAASQNQSISTRVMSYFTNRKAKVTKRDAKRAKLFAQRDSEHSDEDEDSDDNDNDSNDDSQVDDGSETLKSSASTSRLDLDGKKSRRATRVNLSKSNSTSRIKRSLSKQEQTSTEDDSRLTRSERRRRSSSTSNAVSKSELDSSMSATIQVPQTMDPFMYSQTASNIQGSLPSYYSVPQLSTYSMLSSQLLQLQIAAASAAASSEQQQQQQQQNFEQEESQQNQQQIQNLQAQYAYSLNPLFPYYYTFK